MFFSKREKAESAPKRRSTLLTMLNPGFGNSIRPIGENNRVFIKLIAVLFAMQGLFPKDHPALTNAGNNSQVRLTLHEVISTAWGNLSFTEKGMPQVLFFFATIASMALAALAVIAGLFSLFIGSAHAQTPAPSTMFTPPANDLAQNWIDYLFKGQPLSAVLNQSPLSSSHSVANITSTGTINIQCAMMTALGYYSNAVLMVAAIILFYHLATMVVETAHHGQVMGKRANQIWAPIRLVVAVGLLVPLGGNGPPACGTSGAGLNSAQYITIKIAELGSAVASNTWQKFMTTLAGSQFNFIQPTQPRVDKVVHDIFLMEGCLAAYNYYLTADNTSPLFNSGSPEYILIPSPLPFGNPVVATRWDYTPQGNIPNDDDICGHISMKTAAIAPVNDSANDQLDNVPLPPTALAAALMNAHKTALLQMITQIRTDASRAVAYQVPDWDANDFGDVPPPNNSVYQNDVMQYVSDLRASLAGAFTNVNTTLKNNAITSYGWIAAGAWMNTIARDQGAIVNATDDGLPETTPPKLNESDSIQRDTSNAVKLLRTWMTRAYTPGQMSSAPPDCDLSGLSGQAALPDVNKDINSPVKWILSKVDAAAVDAGLWKDENHTCPNNVNTNFILGVQFLSGNPLGELVAYGQNSMRLALQLVDSMFDALSIGIVLNGAKGLVLGAAGPAAEGDGRGKGLATGLANLVGAGTTAVVGIIITIYSMLAIVFLTVGVTLAYILPLIPFMHFFFASIAWGLVLLEGVIAMPLVALAHLNPEGDGLPGGMAKQAYFMLLGLFMRPVLIVFGFIASLLIFFMAMFLLNKLFGLTVVGTGGLAPGLATVSRIIFTVMYVFLAYTCAANCFKVVDSMPEAVFRWVSISLGHQKIADGGSVVQNAGGVVTAFAGQQAMGAIQNIGQQATTGASGIGEGLGSLGRTALGGLGKSGKNITPTPGSPSGTNSPAPQIPPPGGGRHP